MLARGFDGELRHLPGPPISRAALAVLGLSLAGLVLFELAAQAWIPTL